MGKFVIFDIDGTIANLKHRLKYIQTEEKKDWDSFFATVKDDEPIHETIAVLKAMKNAGFEIVLVSGRNEDCREDTEEWLAHHGIEYDALYMRKSRDRRPDDLVKRQILHKKVIPNHGHPFMIFDDRKRVIDMWIEEGYFVCDVSQGQGDF